MRTIIFVCIVSSLALMACDSKQSDKAPAKIETVVSGAVKQSVEPTEVEEPVEVKPVETKAVEVKPKEPAQVVAEIKETPVVKAGQGGEQVYKKSCTGCHASGAAGAPKLGDVAAWKTRIAKGMDALYSSAIKGVPGTAMLPKGTCAACSDRELKAAVDYMVSKVK